MKQLLITLAFYFTLTTFNLLVAQPTIQWEKSYGGSSNETARDIIPTFDGGYAVVGGTNSNDGDVALNKGGTDCWLIKIDANGNKEWQQTYGGSGNDFAYSIVQTLDSGFVFFAISNSNDGDIGNSKGAEDMWVVRVDKLGNIVWEKTFGGTSTDYLTDAILTSDNNYVFCGYTDSNNGDVSSNNGSSDMWMVKIDTSGNILWEHTYGGTNVESAYSILSTSDKGFLLVGRSYSSDGDVSNNKGLSDFWVVKTDSLGNIEWEKNYGGSDAEYAISCAEGINGGYVIVGTSFSNDGDVSNHFGGVNRSDYWVVKIDSVGILEWENSYGGTQGDGAELVLPYNGNYVVLGNINSSNGMISNFYGDTALTSPDYWLIQIDTLGNLMWEKNYGGSYRDSPFGLIVKNGSIVMAGAASSIDYDVTNNIGVLDFWVVKLNAITDIKGVFEQGNFIYPNPVANSFYIEIEDEHATVEIYTLLGKRVLYKQINKGSNKVVVSSLLNGVYIVNVRANNSSYSQKLIVNN